jgi:hypothetical protein
LYIYNKKELTYVVTCGLTEIIPSITLVTVPVDVCVISKSYTYRSASKEAVSAAVIDNVTTPVVGSPEIVAVMVVLVLVEAYPFAILAAAV